jgi:hypothetical protein
MKNVASVRVIGGMSRGSLAFGANWNSTNASGVGAGLLHGVAMLHGIGHSSPGTRAACQIGRDRHHHRRPHRQLICSDPKGFHRRFDGASQIGSRRQLHAAGEGEGVDVEVAVAHHLLQAGRHLHDVEVVVGRGNRDDGRAQGGVAHDLLHVVLQQPGQGKLLVDHHQECLLGLTAREEVKVQRPGLGGVTTRQVAAAARFLQGPDHAQQLILDPRDGQRTQHLLQAGSDFRRALRLRRRMHRDHIEKYENRRSQSSAHPSRLIVLVH